MYLLEILWNWILDFLLFPIRNFWQKLEENPEESFGKKLALFLLSLLGLFVLGGLLIWFILYMLSKRFEIVIGIVFLGFLYSYGRNKYLEKAAKSNSVQLEQQSFQEKQQEEMETKARNDHYIMRNIMYQTLKTSADSIGGIPPRVLEEIQVDGKPYYFSANNAICFHSFKLKKQNINSNYTTEELQIFARTLESDIAYKVSCGLFPSLSIQNVVDEQGTHPIIQIDIIEDIGNLLLIQSVFYNSSYALYLQNKQLNENQTNNSLQDETW